MRQTCPWLEMTDYASFPIDAWEERLVGGEKAVGR